ncbi:MAG: DUF3426 domain-containing protein [Acidobacteria bacterium]|nr:DUF3426 domain-containing protein [Acidobacteriota bacterium]
MLASLAAVLAAGGAAFWWLDRESRRLSADAPALTQEARQYTRNLKLSEVEKKAAESYFKQEVVEIQGKITNQGGRKLKLVEINCVFRDPYGQVVLRERVAIAGRKMGDLAPGETKTFRLAFDNIPGSWNKVLPDLVIAQIVFA